MSAMLGEQGNSVGGGARWPRCSIASVLMLSGCPQAGAAAPAGALPQAHLHHAGGADEEGPGGGEGGAEGAAASPHPAHLETQLCGERKQKPLAQYSLQTHTQSIHRDIPISRQTDRQTDRN